MLAVCSCVLGEEGAGRCDGCLPVCAREEGAGGYSGCLLVCARAGGSWSLCWLSARVCTGKRELVAVVAVC